MDIVVKSFLLVTVCNAVQTHAMNINKKKSNILINVKDSLQDLVVKPLGVL